LIKLVTSVVGICFGTCFTHAQLRYVHNVDRFENCWVWSCVSSFRALF